MESKEKALVIAFLDQLMTNAAILKNSLDSARGPSRPQGSTPASTAKTEGPGWTPLSEMDEGDKLDVISCVLVDGVWTMKIRYVGSEEFARIAGRMREIGGSYVKEYKNSRFEIPDRRRT
jgi:hypothetical protein